jgi:hypothetical protein
MEPMSFESVPKRRRVHALEMRKQRRKPAQPFQCSNSGLSPVEEFHQQQLKSLPLPNL